MAAIPPLLQRALDAHGGLDRFRAAGLIHARFEARGPAFATKLRDPRRRSFEATFDTRAPLATLHDYPRRGSRGRLLAGGAVVIEDGEPTRRDQPREAMVPSYRRPRWDDLDLLYFCAYASWSYFTAPFHLLLPGIELEALAADRLRARYPVGFPAHCREQILFFDADTGLLRQVNYVAHAFGAWARAAHVCDRHRELGGLIHPTRRRVHPRTPGGRAIRAFTLLAIDVHDVTMSA